MLEHLADHDAVEASSVVSRFEQVLQTKVDGARAQPFERAAAAVEARLTDVPAGEAGADALGCEPEQEPVPRPHLEMRARVADALEVRVDVELEHREMVRPQDLRKKEPVHVARHYRRVRVHSLLDFRERGIAIPAVAPELELFLDRK